MAFGRLYLTNVAAPYIPATIRGSWSDTVAAVTRALDTVKDFGGVNASVARAETSSSNTFDVLLYRGVSGPLSAQTITGTINVVIGVLESSASADFAWKLHLYATQGDSDTPRGTLLSNYVETASNEWPTTNQGKALASAQSLSSLAISDGDRLVVEIGYRALNTSTSGFTGTLWYGTRNANDQSILGDLSVGNSSVTTLAGFIDFSSAILQPVLTTRVSQTPVEGVRVGAPEIDNSQVPIEAIRKKYVPAINVSQAVPEVIRKQTLPEIDSSQVPVEVVGIGIIGGVPVRASQVPVELIRKTSGLPEIDNSQTVIEVVGHNIFGVVAANTRPNIFVVT